ncbi:SC5A6-like protein [Mya arenaria]|uniref:SC5A6-like protein n=1 Tax=Mya arenaria TaxID=6604 RepID=A0ABY7DD24_MYAAR|nr:SC5A6-like protein [Mya arenaria]
MLSDRSYSFNTGQKNTFSTVDYVIFGATLAVSTFIGFFYAIKDRKISDTKLFLLAGGNMNFVPVSMSLLASFMSAITLLGTPAEMYNFGTMYWWIGLSYAGSVALAAHVYVPIFYRLRVTTLTGLSLWGAIISVGSLCTIYTAIGGMKAVLWTDTFQTVMMIVGALWVNFPGLCVILLLSCMVGIVMYAFYSTCDPISFKLIMASDQMYPLFVMDLLSHVPGVPGLFVACIFSGTLSSSAALSLFGMLGAPMLGLFTLGMIYPWANYKGAYAGTLTSLVVMLWIGGGAYITKPSSWRPPISTEGCNWNLTQDGRLSPWNTTATPVLISTITTADVINDTVIASASLAEGCLAMLIVCVVGIIVSLITGRQDPRKLDARLVCPIFDVMFPFLPERWRKPLRFGIVHEGKYAADEAEAEVRRESILTLQEEDGSIKLPSPEIEVLLSGNKVHITEKR